MKKNTSAYCKYLNAIEVNTIRPLWSVMIPVYNCAVFLEDTLQCVLQQAPAPDKMEIVVVDDCSTDNPEEVVQRLGGGRVKYVRQPKNLGHTGNFETCLSLSKGRLIHLLHGDDRVLPGFYEAFTSLFEKNPSLMAAFCRHHYIDEHNNIKFPSTEWINGAGEFKDFFNQVTRCQIIQTPSIVVKREVYEKIGMFDHRLSWCEDWEMWARIGKNYPVGYINTVLAEYRMHTRSNSGKYILSGENIRDLKRGIAIINSYIDDSASRRLSKKMVSAYYARYAMDQAVYFLKNNEKSGARNQLKAAFLMSKNLRLNLQIIKLFLKSV